MAVAFEGLHQRSLHPLHAILLAGTVPLFLGVLLSDFAYASSYEVQWKNFASWLIVGGLVFGGFALLWALIELFRRSIEAPTHLFFSFAGDRGCVGFIDALIHAKDAWASMPEGLDPVRDRCRARDRRDVRSASHLRRGRLK